MSSNSIRQGACARRAGVVVMVEAAALLLMSCASSSSSGSSSSGGGMLDKALDLVGLQTKPPPPDAASMESLQAIANKLPKKVALRIHAGELLNTDASGRSLSLVAKVYRLKEIDSFAQLPYDAFKDGGASSSSSNTLQGVIEAREVVLTPGQHYEVIESLPAEVGYVAIVALFRSPDPQRWRFIFEKKAAAKTGITLGAHGCALSVAEGAPVNAPAETLRLAGVRCR